MSKFQSAKPNPNCPEVLDVLADEVAQNPGAACIIDVRQPDEYTGELGHIAGSKLLVLDELAYRIDEIPTNRPVVFVCRSGNRSARAALLAMDSGIKNVYNLKGGMIRWNELGLARE